MRKVQDITSLCFLLLLLSNTQAQEARNPSVKEPTLRRELLKRVEQDQLRTGAGRSRDRPWRFSAYGNFTNQDYFSVVPKAFDSMKNVERKAADALRLCWSRCRDQAFGH